MALKIASFVIGTGLVLYSLALTAGVLVDWSEGKTEAITRDLIYFFFIGLIPFLFGAYCLFYATGKHPLVHNYIKTLLN